MSKPIAFTKEAMAPEAKRCTRHPDTTLDPTDVRCGSCGGAGEIEDDRYGPPEYKTCQDCKGYGEVEGYSCWVCVEEAFSDDEDDDDDDGSDEYVEEYF